MHVTLLAASGRSLVLTVRDADTDAKACDVALKRAEKQYPGEGWKALHVL